MNACPPKERLSAFLDGELPAGEAAAVEAHLRACGACARELAALREVETLSRSLEAPPVSEEEWAAAWKGIAEHLRAAPSRAAGGGLLAKLRRYRYIWMPAAAAALVALAIGLWTGGSDAHRERALATQESPTRLEQARGPNGSASEQTIEFVETSEAYTAMFQEGDVTVITLLPVSPEEAAHDHDSPNPL
ncbi:MAG: anti-sigma factor family protein [Candidatus Brocadiia bacterium]